MLLEEGLENVFARHHRLAEGTRAAVKAWGLELCAREPKWHSDTVSAIMVPPGINGAEVIDVAYRRYNLALGAGLARMAGQAVPHRPPGRSQRAACCWAASPARRWRCATWASRSRRAAASARREEYWREHGQAARASGSCRRARPTRSPPRPRPRRRRPPAPADEPHALRARPPAAAAERAGGAGLAARACSRRRWTARRTTSSSISRTRSRRATRSRRGST